MAGFPTRNLQDLVTLMGKGIGDSLDDTFGPRTVGYAVMIFDFGNAGTFAYRSNAKRAEMIQALEVLVAALKAPAPPSQA